MFLSQYIILLIVISLITNKLLILDLQLKIEKIVL